MTSGQVHATRRYVETNALETQSGFVHVPLSHEQAATREATQPSMALETMRRGLEVGLKTALKE